MTSRMDNQRLSKWMQTLAFPAAIMEMLCGSTSDMLRILPALPKRWEKGDFKDMLTRSGVSVSATWDMGTKKVNLDMETKKVDLVLTALRDTTFDIKFPTELTEFVSSKPAAVEDSNFGSRYRKLTLKKGDELKLNIRLE